MASAQLYRQSKLGDCLVEALDDLINAGKLNPDLAMRVLTEYDTAMIEALEKRVVARASFKGHLDTYRFCDNVWTFVLSSAVIRSHSVGQAYQPEMRSSKLKIVCVDAKLVDPDANPE